MAVTKNKKCQICLTLFIARRDAKTCSATCRKRLQRSLRTKVKEEAARLESAASQEFHRLASSLLSNHVVFEPLLLSDETGSIPGVSIPVEVKENGHPAATPVATPSEQSRKFVHWPEEQSQSGEALRGKPEDIFAPTPIPPQIENQIPPTQPGIPGESTGLNNDPPIVQEVRTPPVGNIVPNGLANTNQATEVQQSVDLFKNDLISPDRPEDSAAVNPYSYSGSIKNTISELLVKSRRRRFVLGLILLLILIGIIGFIIFSLQDKKQSSGTNIPNSIAVSNTPGIDYNDGYKLSVNVPLEANDSLIITPIDKPTDLIQGQIFVDKSNNRLFYYDGTKLHELGSNSTIINNTIQGPTNINNSTIVNSVIQSGVTELTGTNDQVNVSGNTGNITLSLPQSISSSSTPTFAGLNLGSALQTADGGTGGTSFTSNTVLIGNGAGALQTTNVGAAGECLIIDGSGVPTFQGCAGGGGVFAGASQTPGRLTKFDIVTDQIVDSLVSESGAMVTVNGDLSVTGILSGNGSGLSNVDAATLQGNNASFFTDASNISSGILSDSRLSANVARLNAAQTFTGINNFSNAGNSFTGTFAGDGASLTNLNASNISSGTLAVAQGGTGAGTPSGARSSLGAAASGANSDITSLSGLTTALSVIQGGTGQDNFTLNGVLVGNGSGALQVTSSGSAGQCLVSNGGSAPTFQSCTGGLSGDAAARDLSNLSNVAINSDLLPGTFGDINLGSTAFPFNGLYLADASDSFAFGITGAATSEDKTLTIPDFAGSVADICLSTGNCAGSGSGVTASSSSANFVPLFTSAQNITNSIISQDVGATTITIGGGTGDLTVNGVISGDGSGITSIDAANISTGILDDNRLSGNVALLDGTQSFTGVNTFGNASNSFSGNGSGLTSLNATNISLGILNDSHLSANVALLNGNNNFTGVTLQHSGNDVCDISNNCNYAAASGSGSYINNGTSPQTADFNITGTGTVGTLNATTAIQLNGTNINTAGTLSNVAYLNAASQTFTGTNTFSATGGNSIAITGAPTNSATSSLIQIGSPIVGGNSSTNGGTYIGLNAPSSGPGSVADLLNLQVGGVSQFRVTTGGTTNITGAVTASTFSSTGAGTTPAYRAVKTSGNAVLQNFLLSADANPSFQIIGNGQISWGTGGASAVDTTLSRSGAAELTTNGDLVIQGGDLTTNQTTFNLLSGATTALNIGPASTTAVNINLAGGGSDTGCTVAGDTGNLTCSGAIATNATTGTQGWWTRSGSSLSPTNSGDAITTTGNISTSGAGIISSPGSGSNSERFGSGASTSTFIQALAVGNGASVTADSGTAIGNASSAGNKSVAVGNGATAAGAGGIAIGNNAIAGSSVSIAIGQTAVTTASNQLVIGGSGNAIQNAYIGNGVTNASPTGFTLQGTGGSGTDISGASVALAGGRGTGAGNGGNINFQIAKPGTTGSSLNSLATVASLSGVNGAALFKNSADSTTAFQVQNAAGSSTVFNVDTTNSRVGINNAAPAAALDVIGPNGSGGSAVNAITAVGGTGAGTGGTGGGFSFTGGTGVTGATAGVGGGFTVLAGTGGGSPGVGGVGAIGGAISLQGGTGGTGGSVPTAGSTGGAVSITGGTGGNGSGSNGNGGALTLQGGSAGAGAGTAGSYGTVSIQTTSGNTTIGNTTGTAAVTLTAGTGNINLQAGTIVGNATTQNLFNTVATTINFGGAASTAINIGPASTTATSINLAGGGSDTGCTVDGATGNLTCSGAIATIATTGTQGWWSRAGTTLSPVTAGDNITTSGNISTTGSGTLSIAGTSTLTGNVGIGVAPTSNKLEVQGASGVTLGLSTSTNSNSDSAYLQVNNRARFGFNNGNIIIDDNAASKGLNVNLYNGTSSTTVLQLAATTGAAIFKPTANNDSTASFQVQNATATPFLTVDTTGSGKVSVGTVGGSTTLQVNGASGLTTTVTGNSVEFSRDSANYIQATDPAGSLYFGAGGDNDNLSIGPNGNATFKNAVNSSDALVVQNSDGNSLLAVDTQHTYAAIALGSAALTDGVELSFYNSTGAFDMGTTSDPTSLGGANSFYLYSEGGTNPGEYILGIDVNGATTFRNSANSTTAFQVQNTSDIAALSVDTTNLQTTLRGGTDTATLGSELFTGGTSFPATTGWGSISGTGQAATATHVSGTTALSPTPAIGISSGQDYIVTWDITNPNDGGNLTITMGGQTLASYAFDANTSGSFTYSDSASITTSSTANLAFTPNGAFTGTVTNVSVKQVTAYNEPTLTVLNTSGNPSLEVRASSSDSNTFVGLASGASNASGTNNTAFGNYTLQHNVSGDSNTALGIAALQSNITGDNNIGIGQYALAANTSGGDNTAIGVNSLIANTIGFSNIALGNNTLFSNTAGYENIAIGNVALYDNTTGNYNIAIGDLSQRFNTTGTSNVGVGYSTLRDNTTGYNNNALGIYALEHTDGGSDNSAFGTQALVTNTGGSQNVAIGNYSLFNNTTGGFNVAIGVQSLTNNTTGDFNTAIGREADTLFDGLQNATVIGAEAEVGSSNTIILGYSEGRGIYNNVGIGTSFAQNPLVVAPNTYNTGTISQGGGSGSVVGSGTSFDSVMIGATIFYPDGTTGIVTAVADATHLTSSNTTGGWSGDDYAIVWGGFNVNSDASVYLQPTTDSNTAFSISDSTSTTQLSFNTSTASGQLVIGGVLGFSTDDKLALMRSGNGASSTTDNIIRFVTTSGTDWRVGQFAGTNDFSFWNDTLNANSVIFNENGNVQLGANATSATLTADIGGTGTTRAICHSGTAAQTNDVQFVDCTGTPAADYAENYPVVPEANYGDIVATGTNLVNTYDQDANGDIDWSSVKGKVTQLVKSTAPYQSNTIGIVSDNHGDFSSVGHNIKEEDNPMPVALNGRVPVNISTGSEAIQPGDYLTTSSDSGKAMKATGDGFVIGKALEGWTPGSGATQVMVFVEQGYWPGPNPAESLQNGDDVSLNSLTTAVATIDQLTASDATITNLNINGTATITTLHITGDARFDGPTLSFSDNVRGINQPIGDGSSVETIDFNTPYPDTAYAVQCTPSYNTTCYVTDKTVDGFKINFSNPPSDNDQKVDWFVVR